MIVRHATQRGRVLRVLAAAGLVVGATTMSAVTMPGSAHADERFAPAASAPIHPGVMVQSPAGQCTSNFVFAGDGKLYLGQAAHCTGTGSANETDGCKSKSMPLGTKIKIDGASRPGKLVYNSWLAMHETGEKNKDTCAFNDFALVEVDSADEGKVNPTVPHFGGPTGLRQNGLPAGAPLYSYQNSQLRNGIAAFSPKQGMSLGDNGGGYSHEVATVSPGVPGDSGSGFLDSEGRAFGVLSTLNLEPAPGTNGVGDLAKELAYANDHGDLGRISLVNGTEAFHGGPLPSLASAPSERASQDGESARTSHDGPHGTSDGARSAAPGRGMSISPRGQQPSSVADGQAPAPGRSGAGSGGSGSGGSGSGGSGSGGGLLGG